MEKRSTPNRRQFIQLSGLAGAASLLPAGQARASVQAPASVPRGTAKNVIFLVVDGMSHGTLGLANQWKLRHEQTAPHWIKLLERSDIKRSLQDTASADSPVTDSAAAGSAWGCGQRIHNGAINYDPQGNPLKPILSHAKEAGKKTGLVTTCRITHATPAAFTVNVQEREMEDAIARQYLEREVDVLLGGGARHFSQAQADGSVVDFGAKFQEAGYTLATDRDELAAAKGKQRVLGLFSKSHVPYAIDRKNDRSLAQVPGLVEMFKAALASLDGSNEGFFLQVEGGRVDHAGHANDAGAILHEYLEYDNCIPVALEYVKRHPDTLLIVTTDHGTGGCQLDGQGKRYVGSGPALDRINTLKYSFEWLENRFRASGKFNALDFTRATGIKPTAGQSAIVQEALDADAKYLSGAFLEAFGDQLNELTAVGWSSDKHTAECVDLFTMGPGAAAVPAYIKNNELFGHMMSAMGLSEAS
ncbi:MAG: hypothetical protein GVY36_07790 [Verrucomicrobia bacterium]|jgi:alkaline phosphatase|nr:hypothetical protein [Verrucomicrobiota bacterium]